MCQSSLLGYEVVHFLQSFSAGPRQTRSGCLQHVGRESLLYSEENQESITHIDCHFLPDIYLQVISVFHILHTTHHVLSFTLFIHLPLFAFGLAGRQLLLKQLHPLGQLLVSEAQTVHFLLLLPQTLIPLLQLLLISQVK